MEAAFWNSRWDEGRIGFHEGRVNAHLEESSSLFTPGSTVFVPLCGKAEDLAWLAGRGHRVVGVELVERAVQAFFEEHRLVPTVTPGGALKRYEGKGVVILQGDVFAVTPEMLEGATSLYDRAALIALPAELRTRYVKHLRTLMPKGSTGLLVTVDYEQSKMDGPPFSVNEAEVRAHYDGLDVQKLKEVKADGPRFTEIGARELVFKLAL